MPSLLQLPTYSGEDPKKCARHLVPRTGRGVRGSELVQLIAAGSLSGKESFALKEPPFCGHRAGD